MASNLTSFPPSYIAETTGPRLIVIASVFIGLDSIIVALRFATRMTHKAKLGVDDYIIIPALVFSLGMCVISIVEVKIAGVGRHLPVLYIENPQAVVNWAKCGYAIEEIYCAAVAIPKLSILASYLRILTAKPYRISAYIIGGIVSANGIAGIITSLASCHPFSARWDINLSASNCIDAPRFWQGINIPSIATDVMMLLLPLPTIWGLHIDKKQKIALSGVFLLGSFGMIASIIRLIVTFRVTALSDGTWDSADIATWSLVESSCYLIAACLPALRPLYLGVINTLKSLSLYSTTQGQSSTRLDSSANTGRHLDIEMNPYRRIGPLGEEVYCPERLSKTSQVTMMRA